MKYRVQVLNKNTFNLQTVFFQCEEGAAEAYLDEHFLPDLFIHQPDLSAVAGLPTIYWDMDLSGRIVPKSVEEQNYTDQTTILIRQKEQNDDLWQAAWDVNFSQISGAANGLVDRLYDAGAPKGTLCKQWVLGLWNDYYYRKGSVYGHTLATYAGDVDACVAGIATVNLSFDGWLPVPYSVGELLYEGMAYGVI